MVGDLLLALVFGIIFGIFTGLIPGIHVNLVSVFLISVSSVALSYTTPFVLAVFLICLALTHTFIDSIPSIFLGAPDPDMVLSVLPGHQLFLEGKGYLAVKLTVVGSLGCLLISLVLIPLILPALSFLYSLIQPHIGYLLLLVVFVMVIIEKHRFYGFYVFLQAGVLGMIVLNMPSLSQPLFPMLTGLFGISTLFMSLLAQNIVVKQTLFSTVNVKLVDFLKSLGTGVFSGSLTGLLPGLGAAQASIIGLLLVGRSLCSQGMLILIGGINTVNFIFSLATFYALDKARNGAIVAVTQLLDSISYVELVVLLCCALVCGCIAALLALFIARYVSVVVSKINYRFLVIFIMCFVTVLVFLLTGWLGLIVLFVSSFIGVMPVLLNVKRSLNMGCLLVPVMIYFLA